MDAVGGGASGRAAEHLVVRSYDDSDTRKGSDSDTRKCSARIQGCAGARVAAHLVVRESAADDARCWLAACLASVRCSALRMQLPRAKVAGKHWVGRSAAAKIMEMMRM